MINQKEKGLLVSSINTTLQLLNKGVIKGEKNTKEDLLDLKRKLIHMEVKS